MSAHMEQAFIDLLALVKAGVTSASNRVYANRLPQGPTYPCLCYNIVSVTVDQAHDGPCAIEKVWVQFDLFSTGAQTLMALRDEMLNTLHALNQTTQGSTLFGYAHLTLERDDFHQTPIELWRKSLDFEISYQATS